MGSYDFDDFLKAPEDYNVNHKNSDFTRKFMEYHDDTNIDLKLLDMGYKLLQGVKLDPHQIKSKGKYVIFVVTAIRFLMIGLICVMVMQNSGDIVYVINCMRSMSAFLQGFSKGIPLLLYPENMIYIRLGVIKHFWKTSVKGEKSKNYRFWYKVMLGYNYSFYVTYSMFVLKSVFSEVLMFEVYIPDFPFSFTAVLLMQFLLSAIDMSFVAGIDLIFLSSCVLIWRQNKLLVDQFTFIDGKSGYKVTMKQFARCVKHHQFMLDYVNCVIETFKLPLLFQYLVSVLGFSMDLYIVSGNPPMMELFVGAFYLLMLGSQLGLYCFFADKTSQTVEMVADFINNTKWYNNPIYLNKMLVIVLSRSQRDVRFTAGGMVKIDKEGFVDILKTAFSLFTLFRQLKDSSVQIGDF